MKNVFEIFLSVRLSLLKRRRRSKQIILTSEFESAKLKQSKHSPSPRRRWSRQSGEIQQFLESLAFASVLQRATISARFILFDLGNI